jgi:hypothetical protein
MAQPPDVRKIPALASVLNLMVGKPVVSRQATIEAQSFER